MTYDGLTQAELAARLKTPNCLCFDVVTSTLDIIHDLGSEEAPAGTVALADEQLEGRGRQGSAWQSQKGTGILLGYLAYPSVSGDVGVFAIKVGLQLVLALEEIDVTAQIKWPNDVLLNDRKLAGVLCEGRWSGDTLAWIAVGVGINVSGPVPDGFEKTGVALDEVRPGTTRVELLERFVPRLHRLWDLPVLTHQDLEKYRQHDWLAGKQLAGPVAGKVVSLSADGSLMVETETGLEAVQGGSVVTA